MKRAEEAFKQHLDGVKRIRKVFNGWRSSIIRPIHVLAAFLNPAYMCSQKFCEDSEMKKGYLFPT